MGDQVFTTLVWLKAVNKMPDLPKEQLVANCYAAITPSEGLWARYVKEADKLKALGTVDEEDYAVLLHSLDARDRLMELTLGQDEILQGTVEQVLSTAKEKYTKEISRDLATAKRDIHERSEKLNKLANNFADKIGKTIMYTMVCGWGIILVWGLIVSAPNQFDIETLLSRDSVVFSVLVIVTLLNLIFGLKLVDGCKYIANKATERIKSKIINLFSP
jgi:hypothetical protein